MFPGPDEMAFRRRRIAYRACHRGTKEMDWLLGRYAQATIGTASAVELAMLEHLIGMADPELHALILDPSAITDQTLAVAIGRIRRFHGLEGAGAAAE